MTPYKFWKSIFFNGNRLSINNVPFNNTKLYTLLLYKLLHVVMVRKYSLTTLPFLFYLYYFVSHSRHRLVRGHRLLYVFITADENKIRTLCEWHFKLNEFCNVVTLSHFHSHKFFKKKTVFWANFAFLYMRKMFYVRISDGKIQTCQKSKILISDFEIKRKYRFWILKSGF